MILLQITNSSCSILSLHLHNDAAKSVDAPQLTLRTIRRVLRHGVGYGGGVAIDPVLICYIMTICTYIKDANVMLIGESLKRVPPYENNIM